MFTGQTMTEPGFELAAPLFWQRRRVRPGGSLAAEERSPVIVERREGQLDGERLFLDVVESMRSPECAQLAAAAQLHVAFITSGNRGIERDGALPEHSQHFHVAAVIPDRRSDYSARLGHAHHLA